ncbi:zinc finger protein 98-like [Centruroides sculpturatus]|uniref:zinc finger protein 98-like n=1 Tax=Centruroides sculpturatus TaxID=218467 RepID=UPI000C6D6630|nr:zinc finger protein 98-like [Centruroides sculpturatus]
MFFPFVGVQECVCSETSQMSVSEEETTSELPIPCHMITQWPKCTSQSQKLLKKLAVDENEISCEKNYEHSYSITKNCESLAVNQKKEAKISTSSESPSNSSQDSQKDGAISRKWRIFPCPVCGKVYTWQYDLKIHYRIHSGEKPYKCELCGKGFAQSGAVRTHKARHHQDETEESPASPDSNSSQEHVIEIEPNSLLT